MSIETNNLEMYLAQLQIYLNISSNNQFRALPPFSAFSVDVPVTVFHVRIPSF